MKKLNNRFWFQLHGWISLPIWVVFCFVCLSGTVAVISHELTWLSNPQSRASNNDNVAPRSAAQVIDIVQQAYPTADISGIMINEPYLVNTVMFSDKDKPYALAYVNQYSGDIQEVNDGNTFINFMRSLHGWLLFPWQNSYSIGYYIVGFMSLVLLGALSTGLIVYKHFWRGFFNVKLRVNQGKRTLFADLHRLFGVWSLWFMLVMSLTGLWYLVQAVLFQADIEVDPYPAPLAAEQVPYSPNGKPEKAVSLAQALSLTKQQFSDFQLSYIMLPEHNRDTYKFSGGGDFIFFDSYSYNLAVNPWNASIKQQFSPASMSAMQTIMHLADPLHYGTIGGLTTKVIWFLFGLILSGMSITGFCMWWQRLVKAKSRVTQVRFSQTQESH